MEERAQEKKGDENDDDLLSKRRPPPQVVVKSSAAPAPVNNFSSCTSSFTCASFPHANPRAEQTNEPPLLEVEEEHATYTSTSVSTSQNQIPTQSPLVPASENWAADLLLASPTSPPADPVRKSFIAR